MTRGRLFIELRMRASIQIKYGVLLRSYAYQGRKYYRWKKGSREKREIQCRLRKGWYSLKRNAESTNSN